MGFFQKTLNGNKLPPEKHMPFFSLIKALDSQECPVCRLARQAVDEYYDSLLYEAVNDRGFRKRFDGENGFCVQHSGMLLEYHDGLAVGILYRTLLSKTIDAVKKGLTAPINTGNCIICDYRSDTENRFLSLLYSFLEDEELKNAFSGSPGLCVPHFATIKNRGRIPQWFLDFHVLAFANLRSTLDTFLDSCNYIEGRPVPKLSREDLVVWRKVVKVITGNDLIR